MCLHPNVPDLGKHSVCVRIFVDKRANNNFWLVGWLVGWPASCSLQTRMLHRPIFLLRPLLCPRAIRPFRLYSGEPLDGRGSNVNGDETVGASSSTLTLSSPSSTLSTAGRRRKTRSKVVEELQFGDLPNYLLSENCPLSVLRPGTEEGCLKEYAISSVQSRQWQEIGRNIISIYSQHHPTTKPISPAMLLAYSETDGHQLLERVALNIASELEADFLKVPLSHIGNIVNYLVEAIKHGLEGQHKGEIHEDSTLSSIFKYSLGNPHKLLPSDFSNRPNSALLDYLDQCMRQFDPGSTRPKIIYFYADGFSTLPAGVLRQELAQMLRTRRQSPHTGPTLFLICEGSEYRISSDNSFETLEEEPEIDFGRMGPKFDYEAKVRASSKSTVKLLPFLHSAASTLPNDEHQFSENIKNNCFDRELVAPRIVITVPVEAQSRQKHQQRITLDRKLGLFYRNLELIASVMGNLGNKDMFEPLFDVELRRTLLPLLPDLTSRLFSREEALTLSLALPRVDNIDPIGVFAQTLADFCTTHPLVEHASQKLDVSKLDKHEKRLVSCIIRPEQVKTTFEEIGALDRVKETLHELISLRLQRPELFAAGILRHCVSGILLFGPPGTGKTMLAKAVAARSGAAFMAVSASSIFDMYVGEGEKNVKALFRLARRVAPCVIFLDEVDAMLDSREHSQGRASRVEIINEFMSEWDGLLSNGQNDAITILAATNRPFSLDDAVLRRLPRRILVDLPDVAARHQILKLQLVDDHIDPHIDLFKIARLCESYSGSDLRALCQAAATRALRRHLRLEEARIILETDLLDAMEDVPASISERMSTLRDLREWDRIYGEGKHQRATTRPFGFL